MRRCTWSMGSRRTTIAALAALLPMLAASLTVTAAQGGSRAASVAYVVDGVVTRTFPGGIRLRVVSANANARQGLRGRRAIDARVNRARTRVLDRRGRRIRLAAVRVGDRVQVRWYRHAGAIIDFMPYADVIRDFSAPHRRPAPQQPPPPPEQLRRILVAGVALEAATPTGVDIQMTSAPPPLTVGKMLHVPFGAATRFELDGSGSPAGYADIAAGTHVSVSFEVRGVVHPSTLPAAIVVTIVPPRP